MTAGKARRNDLARRVTRWGVQAVRRHGLLPSGVPDRYGDDDRLAGTSLSQTVLVYFPGTREDLYQLRQWYGPLRALDERHPVVVVLQDSRTAAVVRAELGLTAITVARYGRLDDLLSRSEVKLALYVGHNPQNFTCLRFTSLVHVFLSHGDSDKAVAVSNQCKAYDFWFVAGQAAIDRVQAYTMLYDAATRCLPIGRPQLDFDLPSDVGSARSARPTVLYAPTWEGGQPSVAYSSVVSHGPRLVRSLLDSGRFEVVYRPHPLIGVTHADHGEADAEIRRLVVDAAERDPAARHRVDVDPPLNASLAAADLLVCDVSAVAMDWLPYGRPLIVTDPDAPTAVTARTRMLDVVPRLAVSGLDGVVALVARALSEDPQRADRLALTDYYLGDTSPGAATKRFLDACTRVIAVRDTEWSRVTARGPAGP